jgi:putative transport protein
MILMRGIFRLNPDQEAEAYGADRRVFTEPLQTMNIEVTNENLDGLHIDEIPGIGDFGVVISRVKKKDGGVVIGSPQLSLSRGDIIHAVGSALSLKRLEIICGHRTETDVKSIDTTYMSRQIVVTKSVMAGKPLDDLAVVKRRGAVCTRINRAGVQFTPTSNVHLQYGDVLTFVATDAVLREAETELGNSVKDLAHPHIIPIFIGIGLGVLVGSIPFQIPGMPVAMKLGLAGGPLLIAILFSNIRHLGPVVWHLPHSSNMVLREIGIVLFLTCVGLKSGGSFVDILMSGPGFEWMAWGALVTLIPLLAVSIFARAVFKMNFLVICGLMAGASTDPPALAFANTQAASDAPSLTYSTVYPLTMILRVFLAQALVMLLT